MIQTIREMNKDHLEDCSCFGCHPPCRSRYTKEEWADVEKKYRGLNCKHCNETPDAHAKGDWMATPVGSSRGQNMVFPGGACGITQIRSNGIESMPFPYGKNYSSKYVYEPT